MRNVRWFLQGMLALAIVLAFAVAPALAQSTQPVSAGNPDAELQTAMTHAGFAAKYDTLKEVSQHLHHTINCVVGPQDKLFDAAAGNPCQGQGNGALPDLKAKKGSDPVYYEAWWAARVADQGIASQNLEEARAAARIASLALQDARKAK
ncbi:MAG TPA: hypothetical protein VLT62_04625 [Candidatus Methylomirabilis sp.]|nr:hypothetical protein [Candidatus Methylomirabilis sp.]